jgi:TldD protein
VAYYTFPHLLHMNRPRQLLLVLMLLIGLLESNGQGKEKDIILIALKEELNREMAVLKEKEIPAYYIDYKITELENTSFTASFGSIVRDNHNYVRIFTPNVKVGGYQFDNTHTGDEAGHHFMSGFGNIRVLPIDDDPFVLKKEMWESTQTAYRSAMERYKAVRSSAANKVNSKDLPDFSKENASQYYDERPKRLSERWNREEWITQLKKYSNLFAPSADFISAEASFRIGTERKYFVSTEGTEIVQNQEYCYLFISGTIRADDGELLPLNKSYYAPSPESLPTAQVIEHDIADLITKLYLLKKAPLAEPYTGPAILYAQSAGVFFHEIFGHRVEGHRLRSKYDGQTFKEKINEQVLPKTLDVIFDPTLSEYNRKPLNGYYRFDDEGVQGQRVKAVEKGVLKTFLMSRTPLENFTVSNGHGRSSTGMGAVSRQSNLIVENSKPVSMPDLRKMLIKECLKQNKKYGYFFKSVVGGFTNTGRFNPNAFNIFPTEVYRIYTDGRPDELVRGVDLIGTPLAMFAEIQAAGDTKDVFIGFCGAESGSVPVSAVAPSLFVRRIETQKKFKNDQDETLLPSPNEEN